MNKKRRKTPPGDSKPAFHLRAGKNSIPSRLSPPGDSEQASSEHAFSEQAPKPRSDFLKSIRGRPVVVKLNSGVDYRVTNGTSWIMPDRLSNAYDEGVEAFLEFAQMSMSTVKY
ncbi:hypothetical protein L1987_38683 [Smallanthus sonchifolius]|uniref:Uncharacterized protein n=1 Tax=Smallanthus sonchifolius TaxID=185202 RepID=A0ACB9HK73_9ASTR|nr:hypothetical protein L1987_38683 [Smallanthus sonchifolius]